MPTKRKSSTRKTKKSGSAHDLIEDLAEHDSETIMGILRDKYGGDRVDLAMKAAGVLGGVGAAGLAAKYALNTEYGKTAKGKVGLFMGGLNADAKDIVDVVHSNVRGTRQLVNAVSHDVAKKLAVKVLRKEPEAAEAFLKDNGAVHLLRTITNAPGYVADYSVGKMADTFYALFKLMGVETVWTPELDKNRTAEIQSVWYDLLGFFGTTNDSRFALAGAEKLQQPVKLSIGFGNEGRSMDVEIKNTMQYTAILNAITKLEGEKTHTDALKTLVAEELKVTGLSDVVAETAAKAATDVKKSPAAPSAEDSDSGEIRPESK